MVEPEIWEFLDWLTDVADGLRARPSCPRSTTSTRPTSGSRRTATGPTTSCCPGWSSTAFETGRRGAPREPPRAARPSGSSRRSTATTASRSARTSMASSSRPRCCDLADARRGARRQRQPHPVGRRTPTAVDVHQLNCTYYSALGEDDDRYLAARAIQLFARGVPQVYYVGLLAGANDHGGRRARPARVAPSTATTTRCAEIDAALERGRRAPAPRAGPPARDASRPSTGGSTSSRRRRRRCGCAGRPAGTPVCSRSTSARAGSRSPSSP